MKGWEEMGNKGRERVGGMGGGEVKKGNEVP